jgi:short-subunit dehydrogenase
MADSLAASGFNLVLIGRTPEPLAETAERVGSHGTQVRTLRLDLTAPDVLARVQAATEGLDVGLLVYNAGANAYGTAFVDGELDRFATVVTVNTTSRMALCHHFGRAMKARGRGGILLVGSLAGYAGSPYIAVYNAAKAFSRVFAEGLWYELAPFGVDVVEFVVGGIRTPAMARRGMKFGPDTAEPEAIAAEGLAHIGDGPVFNSELAGGVAKAEQLGAWPRGPVVSAAGDNLKALGLYG